jgi:hypothetical protein
MKTLLLILTLSSLMLAMSCATTDSRIAKRQTEFNSWPPDVQEKVRAGKVELGFTQEMVRVALGDPDRVISRATEHGVSEGWVYRDKGPHFSFGLGLGSAHGSTAMGAGMRVGDDFREDEKVRVMFENGKVSAIETPR